MHGGLPPFDARYAPYDPHELSRVILAEPRFRMLAQTASRRTWWDVFTSWLGDRWNQLVEAFAHHVHVSAKAGIAAGDVLLLLAAGAVVFAVIRMVAGSFREDGIVREVRSLSPQPHAEALYAHSVRAAERCAYRSAVTLLFRAALALLDVRGVIRADPSRTVNECLREVRAHTPQSQSAFATLAGAFTSALYADRPVTDAQWNAALSAYAELARGMRRAA